MSDLIEKISDINESLILLNADKHHSRSAARINTKYTVVIAVMAVMLIGATAFATSESAFAGGHGHKKSYEKSQAISQVNECGNGFMPYNCQNTASQIQGDENGVSSASVQESTTKKHNNTHN